MGWELTKKDVTPGERWAALGIQLVLGALAFLGLWLLDGANGSWRIVWIYLALALVVLALTVQVIHHRVRARQQRGE